MSLRIIGDVHGKFEDYLKIAGEASFSLQVGDMGFDYEKLSALDPARHKFIGGNHDNYDILGVSPPPHYLKDFGGCALGGVNLFFVRGAYSIDWKWRIPGLSWWPDEEMSYGSLEEAIGLYKQERPSIVISHACPPMITSLLIRPGARLFGSRTEHALEEMATAHKPALHVFGHMHQKFDKVIGGTRYVCLPELCYMDVTQS